jgi:hypothetical protein
VIVLPIRVSDDAPLLNITLITRVWSQASAMTRRSAISAWLVTTFSISALTARSATALGTMHAWSGSGLVSSTSSWFSSWRIEV